MIPIGPLPGSSSGPMPDVPVPTGPAALLLSRDLIFTSKITGTARELGRQIMVAGNLALVQALLARWTPCAVFIDLAAGDLVSPANLKTLIEQTGSKVPYVAFGSHVDVQGLAAARDAGCAEVMPRSRFVNELPQLIQALIPASTSNPDPN